MQHNEIVTAMTADRGVRVTVIRADAMVSDVLAVQLPTHSDEILGKLLVAAVLVREAMAPDFRVQLTLRSNKGMVFADSYPGGITRGVVGGVALKGCVPLHFQVARVLKNGELHQGVVEAESTDVAAVLEHYMRTSEQIESSVKLSLVADGLRISCGGVLAQLLPGGTSSQLADVTATMNTTDLLSSSPESTARTLCAGGIILSHHPVTFGCVCSHEKVVGALATLGQEELSEAVEAGESLTLTCEYCRTDYDVTPADLVSLLAN